MACRKTIQKGDHVIFKRDEVSKVFQISQKRQIFFAKTKIHSDQLIGQAYGTLFEVQQGKLIPVTSEATTVTGAESVSGKDNRNLVASEENQKLGQEEIMKMKQEGYSGQEIIGKLVEQSETFKTKTGFSQEKYIKKKKKKHTVEFRVLQPNASRLLDVYKQTLFKICNLRADSLSQLLSYSNVMSEGTVAVVESCQGLVLGAVMERMGGNGRVVHLYPGNDMNRHNVKFFNFSQEGMNMLHEFPLNKLAALEDGTLFTSDTTVEGNIGVVTSADETVNSGPQEKAATVVTSGANFTVSTDMQMSEVSVVKAGDTDSMVVHGMKTDSKDGKGNEDTNVGCEKEDDDAEDGAVAGCGEQNSADGKTGGRGVPVQKRKRNTEESQADREAKKQEQTEKLKETANILLQKNFDGLIIATKYNPVPVLLRLLPYVAPSSCCVVFSQHKEPLVECYAQVREKGLGVQLRLSESWYREYQVLPSRTHPLMSMSGTGGYLLSFIRVTQ